MNYIPLSVPVLRGNELKYVSECVETEWVSSVGKFVSDFENKICEFTGAKHAIAVVNGTAALHISLILSGVSENDEVIAPTVTFIAPINAIRYMKAHPVFMDCDDYYNIDVEKTLSFIQHETEYKKGESFNKKTGRRVKAIMPVHIFGNAVDLTPLLALCQERGIEVIEDATEALGTFYKDSKKAAGTFGKFGCLSFNGNKIITTGGGGIIMTEDSELATKAKYLTTQAKDNEELFIHGDVGFNYRLTNIQAALGVAQMERLPAILQTKKENFAYLQKEIAKIAGLSLQAPPPYADNNLWMYALRIDANIIKKDCLDVMNELKKHAIQTRPLWYLNHQQKPFLDCQSYHIEKAYQLIRNTLNIPCSSNLSLAEMERVIEALRKLS